MRGRSCGFAQTAHQPVAYLCTKLNGAFTFSKFPLLGREKPNNFVLVTTLHTQYWRKVLFLFCPAQLSACRCKRSSPKAWCVRKWCTRLTTVFAPLPVSDASSIIWQGRPSQHTLKMAHFLAVLKYIGQGWRRL